jgi:hypothetical protein
MDIASRLRHDSLRLRHDPAGCNRLRLNTGRLRVDIGRRRTDRNSRSNTERRSSLRLHLGVFRHDDRPQRLVIAARRPRRNRLNIAAALAAVTGAPHDTSRFASPRLQRSAAESAFLPGCAVDVIDADDAARFGRRARQQERRVVSRTSEPHRQRETMPYPQSGAQRHVWLGENALGDLVAAI